MIKIAISICFAFLITGTIFLFILLLVPNISIIDSDHPFFSKAFDPQKSKILILGSSHVGQLNSTSILHQVSHKFPNIQVYNISISGDIPKERLELLDEIISLNPSIIFYGISYRDFVEKNNDKNLFGFDYSNILKKIDPKNNLDDFNPAVIRIFVINNIKELLGLQPQQQYKTILKEHTPFFPQELENKISTQEERKRHVQNINLPNIESSSKQQVNAIKKIIQKLRDNDIKVIIFTTPLSKEYTDSLSNQTKENFQQILQDLKMEFDVEVYNFTYKYQDLSIWKDSQHIVRNPNASIYSDDITNMIISELEK